MTPHDFTHRLDSRMLGPVGAARLWWSFPDDEDARRDAARIPVTPEAPLPDPSSGMLAVTWLGHASTLLWVDGVTVLVDPVLSPGIPGAAKRLTPPGRTVETLPRVDAVLISHDHYDHLDVRTFASLPRATRIVAGLNTAAFFRARGFTDVVELDWWSSIGLPGLSGEVRVEFVPARHWSRRTLTDRCHRLWGGWVVTAPDGRSIYHAGDTAYGSFLKRIAGRHRRIAIAALPVGAYAPRDLLREVHMDPAEAVRAAGVLDVQRVVPIHWGTFVLSGEPVLEPIEATRRAWARSGRAREDLWDLPIGGSRTL
ncbi:MBL fold metallo-hydrolase [Actinomycetospora termitidis]|uniref:MBL fold metallo-hydrolase n=1 Tax=Actinomycetospora termitidis TaxID=3053470 RepID=A0ABT7ME46_9PSEU|nr:MBL fold metallo-hydrolase [Actinomycetospora sp. Odt1-22]MDL5158147.1 MBL fold metallo-hydrolase [Actinomycetospora sp. Odt1-22]